MFTSQFGDQGKCTCKQSTAMWNINKSNNITRPHNHTHQHKAYTWYNTQPLASNILEIKTT